MSDFKLDIPNAHHLPGKVVTGGQPGEHHLRAAQQAGCRTVINLRPEHEFDGYDEPAAVSNLGMHYVNIPVAGPGDLSEANARRLEEVLGADGATPAMVHCGSGNRVGALMACRARHVHGQDKESALRFGTESGLDPSSPLFAITQNVLD